MNFWSRARGLIVGLGGSVAGISALLYGAGYLVTRAHMNLLGLFEFVEFGSQDFLQEGAKFFAAVGYSLARDAVPLLATIGLIVALLWLVSRGRIAAVNSSTYRSDSSAPACP